MAVRLRHGTVCESIIHCRHYGRRMGTHSSLSGRVKVDKYFCRKCGRIWGEVYVDCHINVDLNGSEEVSLIDYDDETVVAGMNEDMEYLAKHLTELREWDEDLDGS